MLTRILIASSVLGIMGIVFGIGLSYASKIFAVKIDERIARIREALPGANCGACGYAGCDSFAEALVTGEADILGCPVSGEDAVAAVSEILGKQAECGVKRTARVMCHGNCDTSKEKYAYQGMDDCFAAAQVFNGHKACSYGCLGHGNCQRACPFDAIVIEKGVARVIEERCKACGKCVEACPKHLIELMPIDAKYSVMCASKDKGPITKANCDVGCIGCRLCMKACKHDAISMDGFLARIDPLKCVNCGDCAAVCPTHAIRKIDG